MNASALLSAAADSSEAFSAPEIAAIYSILVSTFSLACSSMANNSIYIRTNPAPTKIVRFSALISFISKGHHKVKEKRN